MSVAPPDIVKRMNRRFERHDPKHAFLRGLRGATRVLDIGCGTEGYCARYLTAMNPGIEYYGVDYIEEKDIDAHIKYTRIDLNSDALPFPESYFDAILFIHVIEHMEGHAVWRLGPQIRNLLKPGGKLYLETPNWTSILVP